MDCGYPMYPSNYTGRHIVRDEYGYKVAEGQYINGKKEGIWTTWHTTFRLSLLNSPCLFEREQISSR